MVCIDSLISGRTKARMALYTSHVPRSPGEPNEEGAV